jgi:hypothetical protein
MTTRKLTPKMAKVLALIEAHQAVMDNSGSGWWEPKHNSYGALNGYGPSTAALRKRGLIRHGAKFGWYSVAMIERDHEAALDINEARDYCRAAGYNFLSDAEAIRYATASTVGRGPGDYVFLDAYYLKHNDRVVAVDGSGVQPYTVHMPWWLNGNQVTFTAVETGMGPKAITLAGRTRVRIQRRPMLAGAGCEWVTGCREPAAERTPHPILGEVLSCVRCHQRATAL